MTFLLLNGWRATDGLNSCFDGREQRGRLEAVLGDWELRLEPRGDFTDKEVREHQQKTGQSSVTHLGRLRRVDRSHFDAAEVDDVLDIVEQLISSVTGRVTCCILPVAWRDGAAVWISWSVRRAVDRPLGSPPWLDELYATEQVQTLLERGFATGRDPLKWEVLRRALGYYLSANHDAVVTMKVMLPVSALQLISFGYLVELLPASDPQHLSSSKWGDLSTEDTIRNLLTAVGADLSVPSHLSNLVAAQGKLAARGPAPADALAVGGVRIWGRCDG